MKKIYLLSTTLLTFLCSNTYALDFVTLDTSNPPTITFGTQSEDLDSQFIFKITNGSVSGTDASGNLYNLPDGTDPVFPDFRDALDTEPVGPNAAPLISLTLIDSNTQDILLDGSFINQPTAGLVKVGTITDYALRDTRDNGLVLGMRVELEPSVNGLANPYEINNLFRFGFTGFSTSVGWSRASDADLRLYNATRTRQRFLSSDPLTFDPDVVRLQSDVNVSEGNPRSGYFFIKTDAPFYTTASDSISIYQAGEEGQATNEVFLSAFVPTSTDPNPTTPVPLPIWSILLSAMMIGLFNYLFNYKNK